jgi:hypothetical protein
VRTQNVWFPGDKLLRSPLTRVFAVLDCGLGHVVRSMNAGPIASWLPLQAEYSGMVDNFLKKRRRTCLVWTSSPTHFCPQFALAVLIERHHPHGLITYPLACNWEVSSSSVGPFVPTTTQHLEQIRLPSRELIHCALFGRLISTPWSRNR